MTLQNLQSQIQEKIKFLNNTVGQLTAKRKLLKNNAFEARKEVHALMCHYSDLIQAREAYLLEMCNAEETSRDHQLCTVITKITHALAAFSASMQSQSVIPPNSHYSNFSDSSENKNLSSLLQLWLKKFDELHFSSEQDSQFLNFSDDFSEFIKKLGILNHEVIDAKTPEFINGFKAQNVSAASFLTSGKTEGKLYPSQEGTSLPLLFEDYDADHPEQMLYKTIEAVHKTSDIASTINLRIPRLGNLNKCSNRGADSVKESAPLVKHPTLNEHIPFGSSVCSWLQHIQTDTAPEEDIEILSHATDNPNTVFDGHQIPLSNFSYFEAVSKSPSALWVKKSDVSPTVYSNSVSENLSQNNFNTSSECTLKRDCLQNFPNLESHEAEFWLLNSNFKEKVPDNSDFILFKDNEERIKSSEFYTDNELNLQKWLFLEDKLNENNSSEQHFNELVNNDLSSELTSQLFLEDTKYVKENEFFSIFDNIKNSNNSQWLSKPIESDSSINEHIDNKLVNTWLSSEDTYQSKSTTLNNSPTVLSLKFEDWLIPDKVEIMNCVNY